jgi:hypothetical protein
MAQVKIYTEDTTNLAQFIGLPIPAQPAQLVVAEAHPTEVDTIRLYRSDRDDVNQYILKKQLISEIQDEVGQLLVGDLGMDQAAVLAYLNDTVFTISDYGLITSLYGPTGADGLPADYNMVIVDKATGEVKTIPVFDTIEPE